MCIHFDPTDRLLSYSNTYIRECMHKDIQFSIICNSIKMGTPLISSTFPVYGNFYEKWSKTIHTHAFVYVYNKSVGKNPTVHPTAAGPWGMENRREGVNFHCLPSCQNVLLLLFSDKVYQGKAVTTAWALWCQEVQRCLPLTPACPLWQWTQADLSEREELTEPWASTWAESCCWSFWHLGRKTWYCKKRCLGTPMFIAALITSQDTWEATQVSIDGWMDKQKCTHPYNAISFCLKKEGNPVTCYNGWTLKTLRYVK